MPSSVAALRKLLLRATAEEFRQTFEEFTFQHSIRNLWFALILKNTELFINVFRVD